MAGREDKLRHDSCTRAFAVESTPVVADILLPSATTGLVQEKRGQKYAGTPFDLDDIPSIWIILTAFYCHLGRIRLVLIFA